MYPGYQTEVDQEHGAFFDAMRAADTAADTGPVPQTLQQQCAVLEHLYNILGLTSQMIGLTGEIIEQLEQLPDYGSGVTDEQSNEAAWVDRMRGYLTRLRQLSEELKGMA